jgi:hypothetical protein
VTSIAPAPPAAGSDSVVRLTPNEQVTDDESVRIAVRI